MKTYNLDYARDCASVLEDAADVLDEYGWIRNDLGSVLRGFCALGAFRFVHWQASDLNRLGINPCELVSFNNRIAEPGEVQFLFRWRAQEIRDGR